jgi:hypothetical protein
LTAYYAENRRLAEAAQAEFAERTHGWVFGLAPDAASWAEAWSGPIDASNLTTFVEQADAAGVFVLPEPGEIRSAFSSRDQTEETSGVGFGFWPASAVELIVFAREAIGYDELPGLDALGVLRRVVATFKDPIARDQQS